MSLFLELSLALLFVALAVWCCRKINKNREFYSKFRSPPTVPLLGNALDFSSTTRILPLMQEYFQKYGDVVKVHIGPFHKQILVRDYDLLETLLSSQKLLRKADEYKYFYKWLGTGLLTSWGALWKKRRRILTPTFHFQILEQFVDVFESAGNVLVKKLEKHDGVKSFDIYPYVTLCTLDVICETAMGTSVNAQDNADSEYVKAVKFMCTLVIDRVFSAVKSNSFLYPLTFDYYREIKALEILHKYTNDVIHTRREELLRNRQNPPSDQKSGPEDVGTKKRKAFLDHLLESTIDGEPLSHDDISEEVDTFMFEGHDTTASAVSFTLFCIANHPEVQGKVIAEQRELFGSNFKSASPTYSDLQEMKYLEKVIKETLRLYPSVAFFARLTDQEIVHKGTIIPKGVTFIMVPYGIMRNPKYFKDPEKFDPDRFDTMDGKMPYIYTPFSAGPRNCIGQKFAMLELKSLVSKVLRHFDLSPAFPRHEIVLSAEAVLKSGNGMNTGLKSRS